MHRGLWVNVCLSLVLFQAFAMGQDTSADDQKVEAKVEEFKRQRALAQNAKEQGDYAAAIVAGESMLELARDLLGDDNSLLIERLQFLAECEEGREGWNMAKKLRTEVLNRTIQAYGEANYRVVDARLARDHVSRLKVLTAAQRRQLRDAEAANNQVIHLYQHGQYAAAVELANKVLSDREELLGPDHPETASELNNLGVLYRVQGNHAAAEPLYQRALKIYETTLGPDHPDTANGLDNLGALHVAQGNYAAAEKLFQRALVIKENARGPDHSDTAVTLNNLAALYEAQGNYAAAVPLCQRALKIDETTLGPEH